jgi:ribosomal protein S14
MFKVERYGRVRRAVLVDGLSQRAVAREFWLSRKTIRKMLAYAVPPERNNRGCNRCLCSLCLHCQLGSVGLEPVALVQTARVNQLVPAEGGNLDLCVKHGISDCRRSLVFAP